MISLQTKIKRYANDFERMKKKDINQLIGEIYDKNNNVITDEGLQRFLDTVLSDTITDIKKGGTYYISTHKGDTSLLKEIVVDGKTIQGKHKIEKYLYKENLFNEDMQCLLNSLSEYRGGFKVDNISIRDWIGKKNYSEFRMQYEINYPDNRLFKLSEICVFLTEEQSKKVKTFIDKSIQKRCTKKDYKQLVEEYEKIAESITKEDDDLER